MRSFYIILCVLLPLLFQACSIKENRVDCPCRLTLNLKDARIKKAGEKIDLFFADAQNQLIGKTSVAHAEDEITVKVPKGLVRAYASTGGNCWSASGSGNQIFLETGNQADSIYVYSNIIECMGEEAQDTILLHKQWCSARIVSSQPHRWESSLFKISSRWSGLSFNELDALPGKFSCTARMNATGSFTIRIPRQGDNSLVMKVVGQDAATKGQDAILIPLGEMISNCGYDWKKSDLDDMIIYLDETQMGIRIEIVDWVEVNQDNINM